MKRPLRLAGYIVIGIIAGLLIASVTIWLLSRTPWGMDQARRFAVRWLAERIEGEVRVGRVTGPGLLGGLTIHDFGIIDSQGRPFLAADSVLLEYDWRTLLGGSIVINRAVLYQPQVAFERLPGDTLWNYEHVFVDRSDPDAAPGPRQLIMLNDVRVVNGLASIRMPYEPEGPVTAEDEARLILEDVPGGVVRTMRFDRLNAQLPRVIWESPLEPGQLFEIRSLQTRGFIWSDPFHLQDARGELTLRDGVIAFDLPEVELPSSQAALLGSVQIREGQNVVDVRVDGRRVAFRDLQWLYPPLPDEGGGSLVLRIQTQPDGILWLAEDARLSAPGTRVAGSFGVVTGETLYFTQVDLRASPLDVRFIEGLLPGGLPIDGLLVGTVEVRGPLSALETRGDIQLAGSGPGAGSDVAFSGVFDVRDGRFAARSFSADVRKLELALVRTFAPELRIGGSVSGRVEGSGGAGRLSFTGSLEHASDDGGRSRLEGGGSVEGAGRSRRLDLTLDASPVTLSDLAQQVPALQGLHGDLRGPVRIDGSLDDLGFNAELETAGGPLRLIGRVSGSGAARRVTGTALAYGFRLDAFRPALPHTVVSGRIELDLIGDRLATMTGPLRMQLDSARFGDLPHSQIAIDARLEDGMMYVDSARLRGSLGSGRAIGTVALIEGREGRLEAGFTSEALTALEPFLYAGRGPAADGEPRVAGRVDALATLRGRLGSFALEASARGDELTWGRLAARQVHAELTGTAIGSDAAHLELELTADSLASWTHTMQTAVLHAAGGRDSIALAARGMIAGEERLMATGSLVLAGDNAADVATLIRQPLGLAPEPLVGRARIRIDALRLGGRSPWVLNGPAALRIAGGAAQLDSLVFVRDGGMRAIAAGRVGWSDLESGIAYPLDLSIRATGVPLTDLLGAMRSTTPSAGSVDALLRMSGTTLDPVIDAEINARNVTYGDVRIDHAFMELGYSALAVSTHAEAQYGGRSILSGGGRVPLDLRFAPVGERRLDAPLRITISADSLPPAIPLGLVDGFRNVGGRLDGTIALQGTTLNPALSGGVTIRNGQADWDVSGVRYRDVRGTFTLERDRLLRVELTAASADPRARSRAFAGVGGGSGTITGTLDFTDLADPAFDLRLAADRAFAARRRDVEATVSGEIRLGGRYTRPELAGMLRVEQGTLYIEELYRQYLLAGVELDDPGLLSLVDTSLVAVRPLLGAARNPFVRNLQVRNMQVAVAADSWLRSRDMDVEVSGNLNVAFDRRDEDLRLSGSLNVERGTYTLYYPPFQSRRFQVRDGSIDFPGTPGIDPNLSITAAYKTRTARGEPLDVLAVVSGTLQAPRVRLSSDVQPPISESDLASYLFFGVPTWEVASTGQQNRVTGLGAAALTPSVLGYASSGLQTLVQNAGLLDYVGITTVETGTENQTNAGFGNIFAGTQLEVGRYLGSNVFIGATTRLGSSNLDPGARIEWRFLPEYSFELFAEDRLARTPGFGLRQESGLRKVYGFLLFREWGF